MHTNPRLPTRAAGFSLIEIMIVIVLIGGILALVASKVMGSKDQANFKLADMQLTTLAGKVDQFRSDTGQLPESLDQLATSPGIPGWLGPYAKAAELKDPWGHDIQYRAPGETGPFDLSSLGKDGKAGGDSYDADITYE